MRPGNQNLGTLGRAADIHHIHLYVLALYQLLAGDLLAGEQQRLRRLRAGADSQGHGAGAGIDAGHNAGEDFDINVTFPDEYQVKELAGAPAVFKIKLKSISKKVMPELDDDMVKDSTEFDTVDEYKADVKKKLEEANEKHADSEVEAKIFDKVIENMTAEIPQVMFDNRVNEMISELEQRLAPQGISLDLYMQYTGQTIDTVKKAYAEQAEKQVKLRLALEKIAKLENIEVTEDELKAEFDKLAEAYKLDVDQIKQFIHDDDLKKDIAVGKAVDLIKDAAVIK